MCSYVEIVRADISGAGDTKPRHGCYWYQCGDRYRDHLCSPVDRHYQNHVTTARRLYINNIHRTSSTSVRIYHNVLVHIILLLILSSVVNFASFATFRNSLNKSASRYIQNTSASSVAYVSSQCAIVILRSHCISVILSFFVLFYLVSLSNM